MINLTLDVIFKKKGQELATAIQQSVVETRKVLFDAFACGKEIPNEQIVSTSKRVPRTHQLAFCKFFRSNDLSKHLTLNEEFVKNWFKIYSSNKKPKKSELKYLIPFFDSVHSELSAVFIGQIIRGIGVMLFTLWSKDIIILPPTFSMPSTYSGADRQRKSLCEPLYTEVIGFIQKFRKGKNKITKGFSASLQHNLQFNGWRMIMTTDWHSVEDICAREAVRFLKARNDHVNGKIIYASFAAPVREMLSLIKEAFGDRANYTNDEFLKARDEAFEKPVMSEMYSPFHLQDVIAESDIQEFDFRSVSKKWAKSQINYIKKRQKKGLKTYDTVKDSLSVLNRFLFFHLPEFQRDRGLPFWVPDSPTKFTRKHLDGDDNVPSFLEYVAYGRKSSSIYNHLRRIDDYFKYIESIALVENDTFTNPINRTIDLPLTKKARGTSKSIISQIHLPAMLNYTYAALEFSWYLTDILTNENTLDEERKKIINLVEGLPRDHDYWVDTGSFGFIPFIFIYDNLYPIKRIPKSILSLVVRKIKGLGAVKTPNCGYLIHFLTAFETGIRNLHIKWLDVDSYDIHIDRGQPLPPICKLCISSDKVKTAPWDAHVSHRVIRLLDKQKIMYKRYDEPWVTKSYWYDGHIGSPFGELKPLFPTGGEHSNGGLPYSDETQTENFRKILIAFQNFANEHELFDTPLNIANVEVLVDKSGKKYRKYSSEVTPHSARATVVSHYIKLLPPHLIGKYITGHESDQMVAYYTVIDPEYLKRAERGQALSIAGLHPLLNSTEAEAIHAEAINSALQVAINVNMNDAFSDFGAVAFEHEKLNGECESGITIAHSTSSNQLAFNSTHICPYNNNCPSDVKIEVGERSCGQCWASIKTVDHLPRIAAHIRALQDEHDEKANIIRQMLKKNVCKKIIEQHELSRNKIAAEESAWIATAAILEEFRNDMAKRDDYLVGKPEIVEKQIQGLAAGSSTMSLMLTRVADAKNYPEYFTPQLQASITRLRNKILAQSGDIDALINQPDGYKLLDEFRGIIRSVCDASSSTIDDLSAMMETELPSAGGISLLKVF